MLHDQKAQSLQIRSKYFFTIILSIITSWMAVAQDFSYAKEVVKTLASDEFYGRGYVSSGDKIAAEYISTEFDEIGLKCFKKDYQQKFTTSVNTFPATMSLSINGLQLKAGADYLIDAGSPGLQGSFTTVTIGADDLLDRPTLIEKLRSAQDQFIVIPAYDQADYSKDEQKELTEVINFIKYHPDSPAAGTITLTKDKLTWGGSTIEYSKPSFTVSTKSISGKVLQVSVEVENKFFPKYKTQNVIGYLEGESQDSLVVLIAHYDHLGMMGSDAIFPGANDNASGIALLLNMAKYYKANKPKYNTVFIAFGGEELGLLGAQHFVKNPLFELAKIKFLINFDISGTGDDGIQVVNGSVYKEQFDRLVQINEEQDLLAAVKIRGEACNSDHCIFHIKKVPCFFIYTLGGIQAYHDIYDRSETLPLTEFEDYFRLMTRFIDGIN